MRYCEKQFSDLYLPWLNMAKSHLPSQDWLKTTTQLWPTVSHPTGCQIFRQKWPPSFIVSNFSTPASAFHTPVDMEEWPAGGFPNNTLALQIDLQSFIHINGLWKESHRYWRKAKGNMFDPVEQSPKVKLHKLVSSFLSHCVIIFNFHEP